MIVDHDGAPTLIVRLANARASFITEARAKMWALRPKLTAEGRRLVTFDELRLVKSENPALALSWTLFHTIDDGSPLSGLDIEALPASEMNFIVSVSGFDETAGQVVRARHTFAAQDVRPGHEYVDIISLDEQRRAPCRLRQNSRYPASGDAAGPTCVRRFALRAFPGGWRRKRR